VRLPVATAAVIALALPAAGPAAAPPRIVRVDDLTLRVPSDWHAVRGRTDCDPELLAVVSSAPIRRHDGMLAAPRRDTVEILLLEDHVNRPEGDLRRPRRFTIAWRRLHRLEPCCGIPNAPASMNWFRYDGRLLGFIVYPGRALSTGDGRATLRVLDSLRAA
jgi:hypothetical protein